MLWQSVRTIDSIYYSQRICNIQDPFFLQLCANLIQNALQVYALRPLNRQTQSAIPDKLSKRSETTTHTESSSVV